MTKIHLQNNQFNSESELTLGDLIHFFFKAKWFSLIGIVFGAAAALSYHAMTPIVYESKVTIQIQSQGLINGVPTFTIPSEELLERFKFSRTALEISNIMNITPKDESYLSIVESLKSAAINKSGTFLTLTIKANSPTIAEELAQKIASASIVFISQFNASRINYLENLLKINQKLIASGIYKTDIAALYTVNLNIESLLSSTESLKPYIVDGPTFNSNNDSRKTIPILLLGALLGQGLGLLFFYLKDKFFKK